MFENNHSHVIAYQLNQMKENPLSLKGYKCVISQLKKLRHKIRSWLIFTHLNVIRKKYFLFFKGQVFRLFESPKYLFTYLTL